MLIGLVALVLFVLVSLATSAGYLLWPLPGGLPLGNLLACLGMLAAAAIPLMVKSGGPRFQAVGRIGLVLAALWLPLGIALSGNLALVFADRPYSSLSFRLYTALAAALLLGMLIATLLLTVRTALELSDFDE